MSRLLPKRPRTKKGVLCQDDCRIRWRLSPGNSGLGEATVHRFAREGAKVALLARRVPEGAAVQQAIRTWGGDATFIPCDVTVRDAVEAAVTQTVATYGGLHVRCNNAGMAVRETFPVETDEGWERVLRVNLTGTFLMCRAAWPHLVAAGGGTIINMSSLSAVFGSSEALQELNAPFPSSAYAVAKARSEALTRGLASAGARHHIRATVCARGKS